MRREAFRYTNYKLTKNTNLPLHIDIIIPFVEKKSNINIPLFDKLIFFLIRHNPLRLHSNPQTFSKTAKLTGLTGILIHLTLSLICTLEGGMGIIVDGPTKEGFTTVTGEASKMKTLGMVPTDATDFGGLVSRTTGRSSGGGKRVTLFGTPVSFLLGCLGLNFSFTCDFLEIYNVNCNLCKLKIQIFLALSFCANLQLSYPLIVRLKEFE